jgi:syntaxin 7
LPEDKKFTSLADRIALQIFRITSNVKGIESLVKQLGGRNDNPELRSKLSVITTAQNNLPKLK